MPRGVGSPDMTPSANRPPRASGAPRPAPAQATGVRTAAAAAAPEVATNCRRVVCIVASLGRRAGGPFTPLIEVCPRATRQRKPSEGSVLRRAALDRLDAHELAVEGVLDGGDLAVAVVVEVGDVDPRVDAPQRLDDGRAVWGLASLPCSTTPPASMSISPSACDVIEPPTNSSATFSPAPICVRTSPAMNVWMSPVTKTTSLMPRSLM